jgi:hypothetical protein
MKHALLSLLFLSSTLLAVEPFLEKQELFKTGDDPAFNIYHIPGIVVTAKGTVLAWCEARKGGGDWSDIRILLRRSTDDGKTWEQPVKLSDPWCGCIHSLIQMKSGRLVLVGQEINAQWRHATVMWASDDLGKTWQRGDVLDYGIGTHDHAGSIEGSVIERADGSLYLLLRTESGFLWEAVSKDSLKWSGLKQTAIASVTCFYFNYNFLSWMVSICVESFFNFSICSIKNRNSNLRICCFT